MTRHFHLAAGLAAALALGSTSVWAQGQGHDQDHGKDQKPQSSAQHGAPQSGGGHESASPQHGGGAPSNGNSHGSAPGNSGEHRATTPAPAQSRGNSGNAHYEFSASDRSKLEQHYHRILGNVDRSHRPDFRSGEKIPDRYRGSITPAPESIRGRLPAPPSGYSIGYYQGYTVVYDPTTYLILSVVDLLTN
ncbi:hypothetical protein [Solimonas marina]|uniref:Nickel/cobalt transporter regulator n=1 Tax=Solimonas marina TaxID=2714601 RepID=A0A969W6Y7_9GAMM|nr:hypothetical protein [Solimonas marina]NKF20740.1 hypothetical protein [Solimonas marina]